MLLAVIYCRELLSIVCVKNKKYSIVLSYLLANKTHLPDLPLFFLDGRFKSLKTVTAGFLSGVY